MAEETTPDGNMPNFYQAANSNGIYGEYIRPECMPGQPEQKEMSNEEVEQLAPTELRARTRQELDSIQKDKSRPRSEIYRLAKQVYCQEGRPLIIDTNNTLADIRRNGSTYRNVSLPLTVVMDQDFNTFNPVAYKQQFADKLGIPVGHIKIVSCRAGSVHVQMQLCTDVIDTGYEDKNGTHLSIECIAEKVSTAVANKAFMEFKIFAMEFGKVDTTFVGSKQRVIMNPRWNRAYGPGHTYWSGPLNDGKDRGGEPYFCPSGWTRYAVQFSQTPYDFSNVYDHWPIAYHGTKFRSALMITFSGLMAFDGAWGPGVYLSPAIQCSAAGRYAEPIQLDLNKERQSWSKSHMDLFSKYDGKWIQVAYQVRVKPGSFIKRADTLNVCDSNGKCGGIDRSELEWIVQAPHKSMVGSDKILIYGIMIKVSNTKPPYRV